MLQLPIFDISDFEKLPQPKNSESRLVCVAWPYMNGRLHIGHLAGYLIPADVICRAFRMRGYITAMVSGSDCYGTPILVTALKEQVSPEQIVERYHGFAIHLFKTLRLSFDNYSATVSQTHHRVVQDLFLRILQNGFLFKGVEKQFYSPSLNRFLPDRFVVGDCPRCGAKGIKSDQCEECSAVLAPGEVLNPVSVIDNQPVQLEDSEHYFFDWPKLQNSLESYFNEHRALWRSWISSETEKWLNEGLKPRAVTRDLDWGIPLPVSKISEELKIKNIDQKRIYVWFEAVTGYLSSTIEFCERKNQNYETFWKNPDCKQYYFMGKDNLPFHTLFWPGQLIATQEGFTLPFVPAINQYLLFGEGKFSKSLGRIIDSQEFTDKYGSDRVRFYFSAFSPETSDFSFSEEHFVEQCNSLLVGKVGNLFSRVTKLAGVGFKPAFNFESFEKFSPFLTRYLNHVDAASVRGMVAVALEYADYVNKSFSDSAPWLKDRSSTDFSLSMSNFLTSTALLFNLLKPVIPTAVEQAENLINSHSDYFIESKDSCEQLASRLKVGEITNLFEKL